VRRIDHRGLAVLLVVMCTRLFSTTTPVFELLIRADGSARAAGQLKLHLLPWSEASPVFWRKVSPPRSHADAVAVCVARRATRPGCGSRRARPLQFDFRRRPGW